MTKPFALEGGGLLIDADVSAPGASIMAAVFGSDGAVVHGFSAALSFLEAEGSGSARSRVLWRVGATGRVHNLGHAGMRGNTIQLRFALQNGARLYAFQVVV